MMKYRLSKVARSEKKLKKKKLKKLFKKLNILIKNSIGRIFLMHVSQMFFFSLKTKTKPHTSYFSPTTCRYTISKRGQTIESVLLDVICLSWDAEAAKVGFSVSWEYIMCFWTSEEWGWEGFFFFNEDDFYICIHLRWLERASGINGCYNVVIVMCVLCFPALGSV